VAASIPVGLAIGAVEIAFGMSLYRFLANFDLVDVAQAMGPSIFVGWGSPIVIVVVLASLTLVLRFLSQLLPSVAFETFNTRVRRAISDQTLGGVREASTLAVNDVSHILSNLSPKSAGFVNAVAQFSVATFFFLAVLAGLLTLSGRLTAIALITAGLLGLPILFLRRSYQRYSEAVYRNVAYFTRRIIRDLRNVYFLRISGVNERERGSLRVIAAEVLRNHIRYVSLFSANAAIPAYLGVIVVVTVVWSNARLGFISVGGLVPFVYLLSRTAAAIAQLTMASGQLQYSRPFFREMMGFVQHLFAPPPKAPVEYAESESFGAAEVKVERLVVGRGEPLLEGISFGAHAGQTVVISGESGKGKTTLLMTLIGIVRRMGGSIRWNGVEIDRINPASLREFVGYAGADPFLFDGTIDENIRFGSVRTSVTDAEVDAALECACAGFVRGLDGGRNHLLREGGEGISAGQKQRLAIARALLRDPSILLLDEATANIDEATEATIMERIRKRFPDLLIIAVSHRASMRAFADAVIAV